jgi:hypothetical protein
MTRKLFVPLTVVALCGAGALAAIGIAGEGRNAPQASSLNGDFGSAAGETLHRVAAPSAGASAASVTAAAKRKGKKPKIQYFETDTFPIDEGEGLGDALTCPGKARALGGYFAAASIAVAETRSAPETGKRWFEGITHFGAPDDPPGVVDALIGIVCAKGVK